MQEFLNLMFGYNMILLTNKPTRVTRHSANAIDITNSVTGHSDFKSAIIKTDLSVDLSLQLKQIKQRKGQL